MRRIILTLAIAIGICAQAMAQSNFSLDFTSIGIDLGDAINAPIYKIKAGDGKAVLEPGLRLAAELYSDVKVSIKLAQTAKIDEMKKPAMSTQLMLRLRLYKRYKHSVSIAVGPQAFYRKTWQGEPGYQDEDIYKSGTWQTKVNWLSGELEYNYELSKHNDLSVCLIHLSPQAMGIAVGFKHWISRKSSKCDTCPSFH